MTFLFLSRTCSCRLSASLPSHLTPDQLVLSNTVLQPNQKAFRQPSRWRGSTACACRPGSIECQTTACADACIEFSAVGASNSAVELVLVWTQIRVSIMVFLRVLSLDKLSSTYFPLFQLALRPASTPDSNRRRSSISPPRNHVAFSLAHQVGFEHSISSPGLLLLWERKKNIQTNDRQMTRQKVSPQFIVDRSSARPDRDRGQHHRDFLSNSRYRYRPLTQPDVTDCWPCMLVELPQVSQHVNSNLSYRHYVLMKQKIYYPGQKKNHADWFSCRTASERDLRLQRGEIRPQDLRYHMMHHHDGSPFGQGSIPQVCHWVVTRITVVGLLDWIRYFLRERERENREQRALKRT